MTGTWFVFAVFAAAAGGLDDFSNNLATDLGPLLALFGEKMTMQYLRESTSFLDYFIFAMGPIGVITAMVSTIRVCGSSPLRAFVERAQEGHRVVEVELCTSISRDICELFNNGSIPRALGQSKILEIIYIPATDSDSVSDSQKEKEKEQILPFQDYLQGPNNKEWERDPRELSSVS